MITYKITFFNAIPQKWGNYVLYKSTTEKFSYVKSFDTDSPKRGLAFAKRSVKRARVLNPNLGFNVRIETICSNPSFK